MNDTISDVKFDNPTNVGNTQKDAKKEAESQAANRFDAMSNLNNFLLGDFNKRNGPQFN